MAELAAAMIYFSFCGRFMKGQVRCDVSNVELEAGVHKSAEIDANSKRETEHENFGIFRRHNYGERRGHRFFDAKLALKIVVYVPTVLAYLRKLTRLVVLRVWRWEVWHGGTSSSNNIFQFFWRRRRHVLLDIYKAISNIREDMLCQILSTV